MVLTTNPPLYPASPPREMAQVQPLPRNCGNLRERPQQPPRQQPRTTIIRADVVADMVQALHQQALGHDEINYRNRLAIHVYRSQENTEERERISTLLGIDVFV